jgi:uncharacterized membrane protein
MQIGWLGALKLLGAQAVAQLSGPKAWAASFLIKIVVFFLDYFKVKHDLKKQFEEKLKDYEKAKASPELTEEKKDEALDNFLK